MSAHVLVFRFVPGVHSLFAMDRTLVFGEELVVGDQCTRLHVSYVRVASEDGEVVQFFVVNSYGLYPSVGFEVIKRPLQH